MLGLNDMAQGQYAQALRLFEQMHNLRKMWMSFEMMPPLKHSDMILLSTLSHMLSKHPKVTVSALAKALHQSVPGISQKVSFLEKEGYISRISDDSDRRVAYLHMTEKGVKVTGDALRFMLGNMQAALNRLGEERAQQLILLLEEFGKIAQKSEGVDDFCLNCDDT